MLRSYSTFYRDPCRNSEFAIIQHRAGGALVPILYARCPPAGPHAARPGARLRSRARWRGIGDRGRVLLAERTLDVVVDAHGAPAAWRSFRCDTRSERARCATRARGRTATATQWGTLRNTRARDRGL